MCLSISPAKHSGFPNFTVEHTCIMQMQSIRCCVRSKNVTNASQNIANKYEQRYILTCWRYSRKHRNITFPRTIWSGSCGTNCHASTTSVICTHNVSKDGDRLRRTIPLSRSCASNIFLAKHISSNTPPTHNLVPAHMISHTFATHSVSQASTKQSRQASSNRR